MSFFLSLAVAFAIGFSSAPATAPEQPVTAPVAVQQVAEVDPILAMDAAVTLEESTVTKAFTDERGLYYMASYVESDGSSDSKFGEFTIESLDFPGTFHHYTYQNLRFA